MSRSLYMKAPKLQTDKNTFFMLNYKSRRVLVAPPLDYQTLQLSIRRHFPDIPANDRVSYHTDRLAISEGALIEVSEDIWAAAILLLDSLIVQSEPNLWAPCNSKGQRPSDKTIVLNIHSLSGTVYPLRCMTSMLVRDIIPKYCESQSQPPECSSNYRAIYNGKQLPEDSNFTLDQFGFKDGDQVFTSIFLRGGKPVIYLLPPSGSELDASITLSLCPEWHFSVIYPVVPVAAVESAGQTLKWDVRVKADGTLLERQTGLDVAYLFWEAEALVSKSDASPSLPASEELDESEARFIPNKPQISPANSVALQVSSITPYLDSALKGLGLHTEARTSFITYWLPSFLKHTYVALRFLPQSSYEHAAPLEVSPQPDVVVRIFMLFKGLAEDQVSGEGWKMGVMTDAFQWKSVVGVDEDYAPDDSSLFRVVEWGGMEVHSTSG